jgi:1,4-alpha-glucan branching enzyme
MSDHLRFIRELLALRRSHAALCADAINVFHSHNDNRVLAFHRWLPGIGGDVVVAANFSESTWWSYELGFPRNGHWAEVFNSDVYDNWVNPSTAGNGGQVYVTGPPMHSLPYSSSIVIPANGLVIFAKV